MADRTGIEWTDATWNPITGCSVVSPGCTNCYAMKLAGTRMAHHPSRAGLTRDSNAGPVWTGEVRFNEQWLAQPLQWARPRKIFVCAHGDLFHEAVPDGWIARVWNVMGRCPQHQFQILTKRPQRMREWVSRWADLAGEDFADYARLVRGPEATRRAHPSGRGQLFAAMLEAMGQPPAGAAYPTFDWMEGQLWWPSYLDNVWLGASVEDQKRADERIPHLLATPAVLRFLSCEPLLGPVDLSRIVLINKDGRGPDVTMNPLRGWHGGAGDDAARLDWIICGGESGARARPMAGTWVRAIRDQCAAAGTSFWFKQWGEWAPCGNKPSGTPGRYAFGAWEHDPGRLIEVDGFPRQFDLFGARALLARVGKKAAGAMLDGREHRAFPDA